MKASLSVEDQERVDKLRQLVQQNLTDYYDTDFNLLRWLQGYEGATLEEVAAKLNNHLKARRSLWNFDEFLKQPRNHPVHYHWMYGITGQSGVVDNAIVNFETWGRMDFYGMLQTYSIVEILRTRIYDLENLQHHVMELEKETGKQASIINVLDMTNLKYNKQLLQMVYGPLRNLADFVAMHYVELFKYFVIVNVPSFVYALWTAIRPLLPERTRDKVRILSSSNWRSEILEYATVDVLPAFWNLPGDDQFKAVVQLPRAVDENDYYSKNFKVPKGAMKLRVPAGELQFITIQLDVGQKLSWWIMADRDFGFGVFYTEDLSETDPTKMQTIYPMLGWLPGPLNVPLQDSITAQRNGHYKVLFTNSRAWWHTLNATYVIEIE